MYFFKFDAENDFIKIFENLFFSRKYFLFTITAVWHLARLRYSKLLPNSFICTGMALHWGKITIKLRNGGFGRSWGHFLRANTHTHTNAEIETDLLKKNITLFKECCARRRGRAKKKTDSQICTFILPTLNPNANHYQHMIEWSTAQVTEPPLVTSCDGLSQ